MRFHGYFRSSSSYRCRIAFNLKGLSPEFVPVHLVRGGGQQKTDAYRALNPQALVPTLEVEGAVLTQSPAILEWLEETHPTPALLPKDALTRAQVRAFCAAIACEIHPLQNLRVLAYLEGVLAQGQEGKLAWLRHWIGEGLVACEALLAQRPPTPFAFGAEPGLADVYLVPQIFSARRFDLDLSAMPRLVEIDAACARHPAFVAAHPSRQPDAE